MILAIGDALWINPPYSNVPTKDMHHNSYAWLHSFKSCMTLVDTFYAMAFKWDLCYNCRFCCNRQNILINHYTDVIMNAMTSQITSHMTVYSTVYSGIDQRKHQSSASLAFVRGIHWSPVNSPQKKYFHLMTSLYRTNSSLKCWECCCCSQVKHLCVWSTSGTPFTNVV